MIARLQRANDALIAAILGAASFILLFVRYWVPPGKIFDEIYFARAAEEYLQRRYIYENTHPPVTKLLITLSVMLFGGLPAGDTSWGWRFLNVVAGAVAVSLLFLLAKRVTRSTLFGAYAAVLFAFDGMHFVQSRIATPEGFVVCFSMATLYAFIRYCDAVLDDAPQAVSAPNALLAAIAALVGGALIGFVRFHRETMPAQITVFVIAVAAIYAAVRLWQLRPIGRGWLLATACFGALLITSKWYGVMAYGVIAGTCGWYAIRAWRAGRASPFPIPTVAATLVGVAGIIYALAYIPHFIGLRDLQTLPPRPYTVSDIVTMQVNAFLYHDHLKATHPYASLWWTWPLDLRPILYYANYAGSGAKATAAMIYSMPNPILLWAGLAAVPYVGVLAYRERNRAYALVVIAYLLQWLPWMFSPRIAFIYHFYVNVPLIAICDTIVVQRLGSRWLTIGFAAVVILAFIYFYPILAAVPIPQQAWLQRLWLPSWHD